MQIEKNVYTDITIEETVIHRDRDRDLPMKVFRPGEWQPGDRRAGVVFWFGGGFYKNDMDHFRMQSEYFAHRGMVAFTPDYRLTVEPGVKIPDCLYDGKCALAHILGYAAAYGLDPDRLVVCGGSAGGMIAAASVLLEELDVAGESAGPCAMVLFNPALEMDLGMAARAENIVGENGEAINEDMAHLRSSLGEEMMAHPEKYSCIAHVRRGLPPVLILQGTEDPVCSKNLLFCKLYREAGNYIELEEYLGCVHGFFNPGRSERNFYYYQTRKRMEMFLIEQGLLAREEE